MRRFICLPLLFFLGTSAHAVDTPREDNLLFGAVADDQCDESSFTLESTALAAWAAKFAVQAAVGFGASLLDKATESTTVVRTGTAPGFLYRWNSLQKSWRPEGGCIRFWYGRQRSVPANGVDYGRVSADSELPWKALTARWSALGLSERPYVYGEIRLVTRAVDNLLVLHPVVLYARRPPEAEGLLRRPTRLAIGIDLKALGADTNLASHVLEFPDVASGPILIRGDSATKGLTSGWAVLPPPPNDAPSSGKYLQAGAFTAFISFTSASDGTLFGKAVASTFQAQKEELASALTPQSKAQKLEDQQTAVVAAFDAIATVLDAQTKLDEATDATKPRLTLELQKAQYLANLKLQAAGLAPRYPVSGP